VVSFAIDEALDALLGVKTAEAGTAAAAAGGGALCFLFCSIQMTVVKGNGVATLAQNKIFPTKQELLLSEITGLPLDA
jgi:hypothetical protein